MPEHEHTTEHEIEQHPQDSVAFRGTKQATDATYRHLRDIVLAHIQDENDGIEEYVDLSETQLRRVTVEDGVLSYDATHPSVTHESELEDDINLRDDEVEA